jgi:UDP-glucose:(heptosyl)LPS alpha-1,3-glucosyltransferase
MSEQIAFEAGRAAASHIAIAVAKLSTVGGKERDAVAIAGGLAARGHSVTILTCAAGLQVPSGVVVCLMTGVSGRTNHARMRRYARAVAEARRTSSFDAIISFEKLEDADAYYAADVCFASRVGYFNAWLPRYATYARLEERCFGADGPDILFLCRKQESEYRQHYRLAAGRAAVLPPMIHPAGENRFYERRAKTREQFGIPETAILAVSVAVYPKTKGVDRSILALREIPELHLLVAGLKENQADSVKAMAARAGVAARTFLIGHRNDIPDILGAADLMLHPARVENTGLAILESLLAGTPVIASAICGFSEYIERFGAGIVIADPFDHSTYLETIRRTLVPNKLTELKSRARASAPHLRAEGGLERILDAIESTLARRQNARLEQSWARRASQLIAAQ